jgi:hypothetical protein
LLKNEDKVAQANLLSFAAEKMEMLHRDNFVHGDFLARNVCLDWAGQKLYFLDNDRTRHWPFSPPFWRPRRNLAQFCYNLMLLDGAGDSPLPEAFLRSYAEMRPDWPVSRRQEEVARVLQQVQQRWERDGEWELARRKQKQAAAKADAQAGCEPKVQL